MILKYSTVQLKANREFPGNSPNGEFTNWGIWRTSTGECGEFPGNLGNIDLNITIGISGHFKLKDLVHRQVAHVLFCGIYLMSAIIFPNWKAAVIKKWGSHSGEFMRNFWNLRILHGEFPEYSPSSPGILWEHSPSSFQLNSTVTLQTINAHEKGPLILRLWVSLSTFAQGLRLVDLHRQVPWLNVMTFWHRLKPKRL